MIKKLVLHLGVHKTATTSLQKFLAAHRRHLCKHGVDYIPLDEMRSNMTPLMRSMKPKDRAALGRVVKKIASPVALWSDETMLGWTHDIMSGTLYRYAENRVRRLCEDFPDTQIELLLVVRVPVRYLASMYCECIKHRDFIDFETYAESFDVERFSFLELFSWLHDLPENARVTVLPFEAALGGGPEKIVSTALSLAGAEASGIDLAKISEWRARVSFSQEEIALTQHISDTASPRAARHFLEMIETMNSRFGETRFSPIPTSVAQKLETRYATDLRVFNNRNCADYRFI